MSKKMSKYTRVGQNIWEDGNETKPLNIQIY